MDTVEDFKKQSKFLFSVFRELYPSQMASNAGPVAQAPADDSAASSAVSFVMKSKCDVSLPQGPPASKPNPKADEKKQAPPKDQSPAAKQPTRQRYVKRPPQTTT